METWQIVSLIMVPIIIMLAIIVARELRRKKKPKKVDVSLELEPIYNALGLNNIVSVIKVQDRIRLEIKEKDLIDVKTLQQLGIMASIKGLELTILYRKDSDKLYNYLKDRV